MAFLVLKNASVTVNSVDLSDHVKQVTLNYSAESIEDTAMGATFKSRVAGLKDWSVDVEFYQDYAASEVDATLFPLVGAAAFAIIVKPDAGATSATNPAYSGNVLLPEYTPVAGSVGEISMASVTFEADGILTRATT